MGRVTQFLKRVLDAIFSPAEDPRKTLGYTFQRQSELLDTVQRALADLAAARAGLEEEIEVIKKKLPRLEKQAKSALADGQDDLARAIRERRQIALAELDGVKAHIIEIRDEERRLAIVEQRLAAQIEDILAREELVAARYSTADAHQQISVSMDEVMHELSDLKIMLHETEQRAVAIQARASTIDRYVEAEIAELPAYPADGASDVRQSKP